MTHIDRPLSGWGRFPRRTARCRRPDRVGQLATALAAEPACPRGLGRSYGDAATADAVILTEQLDRLLAFDEDSGLLTAEAGVTLDDLIRTFLPRGWFLPLTPGTRFVTLGGAVAADVHGKEHPSGGTFGKHTEQLVLRTPQGVQTLTPADDAFRATVGGVGLTGVIESVTLRLKRAPSAYFHHRRAPTEDLDATMAAVRDAGTPYAVAWLDARRIANPGRGWVDTGDFAAPEALIDAGVIPDAAQAHTVAAPGRRALPFGPPGWLLNGLLLRAFNWRTYHYSADEGYVNLYQYFYPLDALVDWHRLYGKQGLLQYQAVIPAPAEEGIRALLQETVQSGQPCFLATLKRLGDEGDGLLSFPRPGLTLALDFKATKGALALCERLDAIVLEHGGRLYLAKDSRLPAATFARMEGERLDRWRAIQRELDPTGQLTSDLGVRLGLVGRAATP